ncbi:sensor histidine kinase [Mucilaginibacter gilvus]|uniref:Uncharacterized protein n=1 Tax=Mucilaginibacter gilvus TaxID=2305909 RepID=A0A444MLG2_9SPHI|nr:ATP-binding protein [Mucilaginibacter gilvus]RWY50083.1 hypothetical protein EPL05_15085 [Mucilaginibacter gilvus]
MSVPANEIEIFIILITTVFLLAPITLVLFVSQYNLRKKRHSEEKVMMQQNYEMEIAKARVEVHEQTLQTVGADLHDHIGQLLSLTNFTLKSVDELNPDKTREKIDSAIALTSKSIQELRLLGKLLQGEQLIRDGLSKSIRYELDWLERLGKLKIEYHDNNPSAKSGLDANKELMVFRIFQEIINNILRHAEATVMAVTLTYLDDMLELQVTDDGVGFDVPLAQATSPNMGLFNMQYRAKMINGSAVIESGAERGTVVKLTVPYDIIT